jgi:hypothetical protein
MVRFVRVLLVVGSLNAPFIGCSLASDKVTANQKLTTKQLATELRLTPVDEAEKDPSFLAFRQMLLEVVDRMDFEAILHLLDPKIQNRFGGTDGIEEFVEIWNPKHPNSQLWKELGTILRLGGSFSNFGDDSMFCAPYVFSTWDRIEKQIPNHNDPQPLFAAVIRETVEVKEAPNQNSKTTKILSYDIVKIEPQQPSTPEPDLGFLKIATLDGQVGYVPSKTVRGPYDYRACFEKKAGTWRMTALIAGD